MSPLATPHDPGGESIPSGEAAAINRIVAIHLEVQETSDRLRAPVRAASTRKGMAASGGSSSSSPTCPRTSGMECSASRGRSPL